MSATPRTCAPPLRLSSAPTPTVPSPLQLAKVLKGDPTRVLKLSCELVITLRAAAAAGKWETVELELAGRNLVATDKPAAASAAAEGADAGADGAGEGEGGVAAEGTEATGAGAGAGKSATPAAAAGGPLEPTLQPSATAGLDAQVLPEVLAAAVLVAAWRRHQAESAARTAQLEAARAARAAKDARDAEEAAARAAATAAVAAKSVAPVRPEAEVKEKVEAAVPKASVPAAKPPVVVRVHVQEGALFPEAPLPVVVAGKPGDPDVGFHDVEYVSVVLADGALRAKLLDVALSPIGRLHVALAPTGACNPPFPTPLLPAPPVASALTAFPPSLRLLPLSIVRWLPFPTPCALTDLWPARCRECLNVHGFVQVCLVCGVCVPCCVAEPGLASVRAGDVLVGVNDHLVAFMCFAEVAHLVLAAGKAPRLLFARHPFVAPEQPKDRVRLKKARPSGVGGQRLGVGGHVGVCGKGVGVRADACGCVWVKWREGGRCGSQVHVRGRACSLGWATQRVTL